MDKPKVVYVVGLEENGGAWLSREKFYLTREAAEAKRESYKMKEMKVFALYLDGE